MFLIRLVDLIFDVYWFMIFAYILLSWLPNVREGAIGQTLGKFVEPILSPFRKIIPPLGMIDLSPIVALIAVRFAQDGAVALVRMIFGMV
jgi:YggT family protein